MTAMVGTFKEVLGSERLNRSVRPARELMARADGFTGRDQIYRLMNEISRISDEILNSEDELADVEAAAFCAAVSVHLACCDKHGNVTVAMPTMQELTDCVGDFASTASRFELGFYRTGNWKKIRNLDRYPWACSVTISLY